MKIDLRAATLAGDDPNAGGFLSQHTGVAGGFTIANGVVIENAIGGNGNDTLIGNSAANRLKVARATTFTISTARTTWSWIRAATDDNCIDLQLFRSRIENVSSTA